MALTSILAKLRVGSRGGVLDVTRNGSDEKFAKHQNRASNFLELCLLAKNETSSRSNSQKCRTFEMFEFVPSLK